MSVVHTEMVSDFVNDRALNLLTKFVVVGAILDQWAHENHDLGIGTAVRFIAGVHIGIGRRRGIFHDDRQIFEGWGDHRRHRRHGLGDEAFKVGSRYGRHLTKRANSLGGTPQSLRISRLLPRGTTRVAR